MERCAFTLRKRAFKTTHIIRVIICSRKVVKEKIGKVRMYCLVYHCAKVYIFRE